MHTLLFEPAIIPYRRVLVLAVSLGLHGKRSGSLNTSGSLAAAVLGYLTLASPLSVFGCALLAFYLSGSRVTKFKAAFKATLEEPDHVQRPLESAGHNTAKAGGNRNALQVLCNAWFGTACAVIWRSLYSGEIRWSRGTTGQPVWLEQGSWCVTAHTSDVKRYSRPLVLGAVAFWAACAGDTFASELGILSRTQPRLITTLQVVPPGTNGAVSMFGTLMSLAGGLLVGVASVLALAFDNNGACSRDGSSKGWVFHVLVVGAFGGLAGSLIDSLLGATVQESLYSPSDKRIVHSRDLKDKSSKPVINVPGSGFSILSNNQVNLLSAGLAAGAIMYWEARVV